jgi:hypothetical protein
MKQTRANMDDLEFAEIFHREQRRLFPDRNPIVYQDGDSMIFQFRIGDMQSEMFLSDPNYLVIPYNRTGLSSCSSSELRSGSQ